MARVLVAPSRCKPWWQPGQSKRFANELPCAERRLAATRTTGMGRARRHRFSHVSCLSFLLMAGLAPYGCHKTAPPAAAAAQPPSGEVWLTDAQFKQAKIALTPITKRRVDDTIVTSGKITFDDNHVSHVFSPVSGRVVRIDAQLGNIVKKGQALAVIQSPDIGSATSDVGKADADYVAAQHDFDRKKKLFEDHATSKADVEQAEDNFNKAKAERERAVQKAALLRTGGSVDSVSSTFTLTSSIEGEVLARTISPGVEIQGQYSGGTAIELFTVGDLSRVWILADVFEMDLNRVKPGDPVTVRVVANAGRTFEGKVDWVSGMLDPTTRTAKVRCAFDNPDGALKPEMYATVQISVDQRDALAIPRSSVMRLGEQTIAFVKVGTAPDGRIKFQRRALTVEEGEREAWIPVTSGVEAGEEIVSAGAIMLSGML